MARTRIKGVTEISTKTIANIAGNAVCECYGVLGLASMAPLSDGINDILAPEEYTKGIFVRKINNRYEINIYIVLAYGIKVTEIVSEVQKKIRYVLRRAFDLSFRTVNVYVQSIKINS